MSELIGKTIGQYQVIELIYDTDLTFIYKGFQPNMNRYVAVEVLKSNYAADPVMVQAFTQQTELFAQVQHANILPIYDSGQIDGVIFRVLRYVERGLLRDHLFEFRDLHKTAGLLGGITAGLNHIHSLGFVHGNLKPSSIYLDDGGRPLLTDFSAPQISGSVVTPYMSPEQAQGGIVDRRADIYALGVLLYEILVGEAPPAGVVVSPRGKRPDLPESVERVIFKAMAQNPDARFQNAGEFQSALAAALQPVVPAQTSIPPQSSPQPVKTSAPPPPATQKTNWAAIILGILLVVIICAGIGIVFGLFRGDGEETPGAPTAPPAITEVVPTEEPPPTNEPEPTQEPESTQPPEEPPVVENPIEPPTEGPELPAVCGSTGFVGGFFILGSVLAFRKRDWSNQKMGKEK